MNLISFSSHYILVARLFHVRRPWAGQVTRHETRDTPHAQLSADSLRGGQGQAASGEQLYPLHSIFSHLHATDIGMSHSYNFPNGLFTSHLGLIAGRFIHSASESYIPTGIPFSGTLQNANAGEKRRETHSHHVTGSITVETRGERQRRGLGFASTMTYGKREALRAIHWPYVQQQLCGSTVVTTRGASRLLNQRTVTCALR